VIASMLRISEAAAIALHSAALLSDESGGPRSTRELARRLRVSEAHLSKVLQRMSRHGITRSQRGPRGGWLLAGDPQDVTLLQVYEAVEGPLETSSCLLDGPRCLGDCILGDLLTSINSQVREYLSSTRLSSLSCLPALPSIVSRDARPRAIEASLEA
jgi:Rrf2 family protein